MIAVGSMSGKRVAVFGLGGSGLVASRALRAGGATVLCADDNAARVAAADVSGHPTADLHDVDFAELDALVLAPGVPLTHPKPHWTVEKAKDAGVEVIGDIELFDRERRARLPETRLVAITGTNGKSTVTALLGHLLREMGEQVQVGGNIGRPALDLAPIPGIIVLEVSSFQIDLAPGIAPDVGVLLNVESDHLDRHGSFKAYADIKRSLVDKSAAGVIGHDNQTSNWYAREVTRTAMYAGKADSAKKTFGFSARRFKALAEFPRQREFSTNDVFYDVDYHGAVVIASDVERQTFADPPHLRDVHVGWGVHVEKSGEGTRIGDFPEVPSLRGDHNVQNAAAALSVLLALGLDPADALPHFKTFPGLPHRMEEVGRTGEIVFVNDSKATNVGSAETALRALENVYWIAGGKPKPGGLDDFKPDRYRINSAYLIGEAADAFAASLSGKLPTTVCGTLGKAFEAAFADAKAAGGGTVLLSPACASFDQFGSFEERGDAFRALVQEGLAAHG